MPPAPQEYTEHAESLRVWQEDIRIATEGHW